MLIYHMMQLFQWSGLNFQFLHFLERDLGHVPPLSLFSGSHDTGRKLGQPEGHTYMGHEGSAPWGWGLKSDPGVRIKEADQGGSSELPCKSLQMSALVS